SDARRVPHGVPRPCAAARRAGAMGPDHFTGATRLKEETDGPDHLAHGTTTEDNEGAMSLEKREYEIATRAAHFRTQVDAAAGGRCWCSPASGTPRSASSVSRAVRRWRRPDIIAVRSVWRTSGGRWRRKEHDGWGRSPRSVGLITRLTPGGDVSKSRRPAITAMHASWPDLQSTARRCGAMTLRAASSKMLTGATPSPGIGGPAESANGVASSAPPWPTCSNSARM